MGLIQKIFESKNRVEKFIQEKGMAQAVKKFGINKLVMYNFLYHYNGTELFYDNNISVVTRVYNKEGKCLGNVTQLMSPYSKKLGRYFGPCANGNIVLAKRDCKNAVKTYGVFDKNGNQIVNYCKYFNFCFLPNGVALLGNDANTKTKLITIHYDGTVKKQPFTYIVETVDDEEFDYEVYMQDGKESMTYYITAETLNDIMSSETEIGKIEKLI